MGTDALKLSGYLPAVAATRVLQAARIDWLEQELESSDRALEFLLRFLSLRLGPLVDIPGWLDMSADACALEHPQAAADLREAAALERTHQWVAAEDLEQLRRYGRHYLPHVRGELPDDPKIARHMRVRALVPRSEPLVALAIDLELAEIGRKLGPMLDLVCRNRLPLVDGCQFVRIRRDNAERRVRLRSARLNELLAKQPERGPAWATIATDVTSTYVSALEACARASRQRAA